MGANAYPGDPRRGKLPPMHKYVVAAALALAGCGDDAKPHIKEPSPGELLAMLRALPGVHDANQEPTQNASFTYYVLHFEQPVDHDDPSSPTFLQEVSLLHRNINNPMVVWTSGYWDYYLDHDVELTQLLLGNQISIEHRYFAESRPANPDWSKLTIAQMAADEHAIIDAFRSMYPGAFLTSGGSKGGMTAIYHRRFYPDDVDGTVPYVAPISFGAPDLRYEPFLDTLGPDACRQAVRDLAVEMLAHRRTGMLDKTNAQALAKNYAYTRIPVGPAVESAIVSLEWSFWQYYGVTYCDAVPATTASDDDLFKFLDIISPPSDNSDDQIGAFDAYYFQAYFQLGYPDGGAAYLDTYLMYMDADYDGAFPTAQPAYDDGMAMNDIDQWVRKDGERLLFVYGEWDPWTGGKFELGEAKDSLRLVQGMGTHGSHFTKLADADRKAAFAKLEAWTGVKPMIPARVSAREAEMPRLPPALRLALRARRLSP
ncbi:MAG TPA: S28 family serine protease [Kofleriaceae bacterium]|nr:S28 family serine protease [Kofleriaceae bacterium]